MHHIVGASAPDTHVSFVNATHDHYPDRLLGTEISEHSSAAAMAGPVETVRQFWFDCADYAVGTETSPMFENTEAVPFFPTYVWKHDMAVESYTRINALIREKILRLVEASGEDPQPNGWQTDPDMHQLPEFQELNRYILAASNGVLNFNEVDHEEMQITGCWANISPKGGDHPAHQHPNNFLSGVYYVSVPKGSGIITFHDPRSQAHIISPKVNRVNFYNASTIDVEVREGLMCLFPGWLIHSVPRNPSEERRISVSFNINFAHFTERISPPIWRANVRSRI